MTATASQAWAILKRHARDEIATLRLQDLCNDNERVSSLVAVHNSTTAISSTPSTATGNSNHNSMLLVDLSRQRMTLETLNHLLKLSVTRGVRKYIQRLAWGQNNPEQPLQNLLVQPPHSSHHAPHARYQHYANNNHNNHNRKGAMSTRHSSSSMTAKDASATFPNNSSSTPTNQEHHNTNNNSFPAVMPSMHLALRAPKDQGLHMLTLDGVNALTGIHRDWDRLERLSESIRRGAWRGATGSMIRDVVVIGRGVAVQALKFIDAALEYDETATMARKFGLEGGAGSSSDWTNSAGRLIRRGLTGTSSSSQQQVPLSPHRRIHFVTSVDPLAAASLVATLDAGSTMVISLALQGNEETGLATKTMKHWLLQQLGGGTTTTSTPASQQPPPAAASRKADSILSKHMLLITGNDQIATNINKPESVFVIPEHSRCEAFLSFSAATLLPMSIVFGWSICEQFLAGGHDLDCHFVETNPRHNLPVLLALTDVWNDAFLGASSSGRVVTPYTQSMKAFPAFVAALESQTCSGASNNNDKNNNPHHLSCSSMVLDGGSDSAYDRALYQSSKIQNTELVMVMNTQLQANAGRNLGAQGMDDVYDHADALICSLFGHADEMAFGGGKDSSMTAADQQHAYDNSNSSLPQPFNNQHHQDGHQHRWEGQTASSSEGNRPSSLLICGKLDAWACGQLIALSEHRAAVKARIWDIDPFAGDAGYTLKTSRTEQLREDLEKIYVAQEMGAESESDDEQETEGLNLSTKTILGHYARVRS